MAFDIPYIDIGKYLSENHPHTKLSKLKKKEKSARVLVHSIFILITGSKCTYFPNNGNASEITGFNTTLIKGQVRSKKCLICCRELYQNNQYFSSYRRISFGGPFDVGGVR